MSSSPLAEKRRFFGTWVFLILPVIFLSSLGILTLISAGASRTDPYILAKKQALWMSIAMLAAFAAAFVDLKMLRKISIPLAVISVIALLIVLLAGKEVNGARRWLEIGPLVVQPSDLAKFALIILLSSYLCKNQRQMDSFWRGFIFPFCIVGIFCVPIILEPDFGTTLLCGTVGLTLILLAGVRLRYLIPAATALGIVFCIAIYLNPNRFYRLVSFLDLEGNKNAGTYQLYQAILAFGSGGIEGVGIGQGRQQYSFLPEAHTDFIFAIIGEELGLFATLAVTIMFFNLFAVTIRCLKRAPNIFEFSIAMGAMLMIVLQALFNMCVVTGLMPTKGISLPFLSYGGSNLVMMFAFTGLLVNCVRSWNKPSKIKITEI